MNVPFVNLRLQYESIREELDAAVHEVFTKSQFIGGELVKKFETEFAAKLQSKHCIGTGNGTDSLFIILKALGIGPGDEVITPAFSFIASAEVISLTGARPVFVDVDPVFYTISPTEVEKKINTKTKAVIAVHLYGQAASVSQLQALSKKHNLFLIEDCAQAHLTKENGKSVGTFGIASAFSFYPTKNLGAYGDGGCVLTQDDALAEKIRRVANHGALQKDDHEIEGTNSRLDSLQASVLSIKLKYLQQWNDRRVAIAKQYHQLLLKAEVVLPEVRENTEHTFHIYAIRCKQRNALRKYLNEQGIDTLIHYPQAIPLTNTYKHMGYSSKDFPVAVQLQEEILSLPVFPELTREQVTHVASNILNFF